MGHPRRFERPMSRPSIPAWFHRAVFYQVYPQSFYDANGDGIGDLAGLIEKLPYIASVGCNAVWINPFFVSPFQDAGYDVADYYKVAQRYGSNADAKRLFAAAKKQGIRICLDLVPCHTSLQHPWFKQSELPGPNKYRDWFIWTDSAWVGPNEPGMEGVRGYSDRDDAYVTSFFYSQPALNYGFAQPDPKKKWQLPLSHPTVKSVTAEMLKVMRFWLKMGADGFRVDMAGHMVKQDPGQKANIKLWQGISRTLKKAYPESVLISEWGVPSRALRAGFDADFMLHFPTPEDIDVGNLALLAFAVTAQESLPPIRVVAVAATHELRILDGHHRACLAALRGERVPAWVVEV
jgi:maltose alpha-D-glucosyltransferase/alpha-amylase